MAFRNKAKFILEFNPDILIVPECEHPDKLKFDSEVKVPNDILWYGTNLNKGIGVFSYTNYKLELLKCHNDSFKNILPISVTGENVDFIMFAIWANNPKDKEGQYVTQIWKAINFYESLLSESKILLIGDFNSNTIWDKPRRVGNHSDVVKKLNDKNIYSVYHEYFNQLQGKEIHPTLFMYRHENRPYHIDYCFASKYFLDLLESVEVGMYQDWTKHSDHKPLIVKFNL